MKKSDNFADKHRKMNLIISTIYVLSKKHFTVQEQV